MMFAVSFLLFNCLIYEGEPCIFFFTQFSFLFVGFALYAVPSCGRGKFDFFMTMFFPIFFLRLIFTVYAAVGLSGKFRLVSFTFQEPVIAHRAHLKVILVVIDFLGINPNEVLKVVLAASNLPSVVHDRYGI